MSAQPAVSQGQPGAPGRVSSSRYGTAMYLQPIALWKAMVPCMSSTMLAYGTWEETAARPVLPRISLICSAV